jgi:hypothetical protein
MIDNAARDAHLNFLRVSMRVAFDIMLLRTFLASYLILTVICDVFVFIIVKALNNNAISDESLAFFDFVVDD